MSESVNLALPLIAASQAQKHVTHNEALEIIDAVLQLSVIARSLTAPPGAPANGARYLVAAGGTGGWSGHDGEIAIRLDGVWRFAVPRTGWRLWVEAEDMLVVHDGAGWRDITDIDVLQDMALLGVNTTADAVNKFSLRSGAALFSAVYAADGGSGDMRHMINKETAGDTAAQLYQSGFSGRAETGLSGDDDFHVKVSPDGASWKEALVLDRSSGLATLYGDPTAARHAATKQYVDAGMCVLAASGAAVSHTGDTLEAVLATITVPAGAIGASGVLRITTVWTMTNNANTKTARLRFGGAGGTIYSQVAGSTVPTVRIQAQIHNRNSAAAQVGFISTGPGFGFAAGSLVTSAVDTSAAADLVITGQLANSADTITLESILVEIARRT